MPKLIIFDCDGVLVDSEPIANRVLAEYLSEHGLPTTWQQSITRFVGLSLSSIRTEVLHSDGVVLPDDFESTLMERDRQAFEVDLKAIDGIMEVLDALTIPFCVASSGTHRKIRSSLSLAGLNTYFGEHVFSSEDVSLGKPAPDLFLHAARNMMIEPTHTVVVEDSLAGVKAGARAGMRVFGFLGGGHIQEGHGTRMTDAGAELTFHHMPDLVRLIA